MKEREDAARLLEGQLQQQSIALKAWETSLNGRVAELAVRETSLTAALEELRGLVKQLGKDGGEGGVPSGGSPGGKELGKGGGEGGGPSGGPPGGKAKGMAQPVAPGLVAARRGRTRHRGQGGSSSGHCGGGGSG